MEPSSPADDQVYLDALGGCVRVCAVPTKLLATRIKAGVKPMVAKLALGIIDGQGAPMFTEAEVAVLIGKHGDRTFAPILDRIDELTGDTDEKLHLRHDPRLPRSARSVIRTTVSTTALTRRRGATHRGRSRGARCGSPRRAGSRRTSTSSTRAGPTGDPDLADPDPAPHSGAAAARPKGGRQ